MRSGAVRDRHRASPGLLDLEAQKTASGPDFRFLSATHRPPSSCAAAAPGAFRHHDPRRPSPSPSPPLSKSPIEAAASIKASERTTSPRNGFPPSALNPYHSSADYRLPKEIMLNILVKATEDDLALADGSRGITRNSRYRPLPKSAISHIKAHFRLLKLVMRVSRHAFKAAVPALYSTIYVLPSDKVDLEAQLAATLAIACEPPCSQAKARTYGSFVRNVVYVGRAPGIAFPKLMALAPEAHEVRFGDRADTSGGLDLLRTLHPNVAPKLRALREVDGADVDDVLSAIQSHPLLESFTCRNLAFNKAQSSGLLDILGTRASAMAHSSGLRELYFGGGCSVHLDLLLGLAKAAPHLESLHVDGGVNVIDTPPSLRQLDLASWARDFTQLKDFTFISTAYFDSTGSFDELAGRPTLQMLGLRTDHISSTFFERLVAIRSAPPVGRGVLRELNLQFAGHDHDPPCPDDLVTLSNTSDILNFGRLVLSTTESYPKTATGQKELYRRAQAGMLERRGSGRMAVVV